MAIVRCPDDSWLDYLNSVDQAQWLMGRATRGWSKLCVCKMSLQGEKLTYISVRLACLSALILKRSADSSYN